jgi:hypothetical protein
MELAAALILLAVGLMLERSRMADVKARITRHRRRD